MADNDKTNDEPQGESIDYSAEQKKVDEQKAKARDADRERLAAESE